MNIIFKPIGRIGNAIFRYLASVLLIIKSNYKYNYIDSNKLLIPFKIVRNPDFVRYVNDPNIIPNLNLVMGDFYQIENVYTECKSNIIDYINNHKFEHTIKSQLDNGTVTYYLHQFIDNQTCINMYDIVIHIRLDDFVTINEHIPIQKLIDLMEKIEFNINHKIGLVFDQIKTNFEKIYIDQLTNWFSNRHLSVSIENNDVITDFHIMKNARILICSRSTLSWCAAYLSTNIEKCYMPNYPILRKRPYQTFKTPIQNTILYDI